MILIEQRANEIGSSYEQEILVETYAIKFMRKVETTYKVARLTFVPTKRGPYRKNKLRLRDLRLDHPPLPSESLPLRACRLRLITIKMEMTLRSPRIS
jgi:hypothetical protein